ncbi:MAG TPA: putative sugar O-methyltransferase [Acidimicrobiales bacterium]|nr:putative sugar O-methyltransferase [Acidimicrobiales bacterium]
MGEAPEDDFGRPAREVSQFWNELQAEHARILRNYGPETMKRQQALRYFTWRWSWSGLRRSEQFRFLLRHSTPIDVMRAILAKTNLDDSLWQEVPWPRADRRLYCVATRLLWQYTERVTGGHPALGLAEPLLGSPLPVSFDSRLISQDLANTALELSAMERGGADKPHHVLEIGAGYGRTAYVFLSLYDDCRYTIVDIEPALTLSRWYLSQLFEPERLTFLTPEQIQSVSAKSVDLGVSISTLSEMTPRTRDSYLDFLDEVTAGGRIYLKQWMNWHNPVDNLDVRFDDFAIPERWVLVLKERCPVQTRFVQAMWRNPG